MEESARGRATRCWLRWGQSTVGIGMWVGAYWGMGVRERARACHALTGVPAGKPRWVAGCGLARLGDKVLERVFGEGCHAQLASLAAQLDG